MANIYISHIKQDDSLAFALSNVLAESGHNTIIGSEEFLPGETWKSHLDKTFNQAEIFIFILSKNSVDSKFIISELITAGEYSKLLPDDRLLIPILIDDAPPPRIIANSAFIRTDSSNILSAMSAIEIAIEKFLARKNVRVQKEAERKELIEKGAESYITETLINLTSRETKLSHMALYWNLLGWGSLVLGIFVSFLISRSSLIESNEILNNWAIIIFLTVKSLIIISLLVASSKYAFTLAKSYMAESLKIADRIHAISFGRFFIQAYGDKVEMKDIKEAFQHWNISNNSSFTNLDPDKFDPKILETAITIAKILKNDDQKSK